MKIAIAVVLFLTSFISIQIGRSLEAQDIETQFKTMKEQLAQNWMSCEKGK